MQTAALPLFALLAILPGCGSSDDSSKRNSPEVTADPSGKNNGNEQTSSLGKFDPPAPKEGYTRIKVETLKGVGPGADASFCQYIMPGLDHDVDIIDVGGYQSALGHHAVAFSYPDTGTETMGENFPCMGSEVSSGVGSQGAFLGGPAGANDKGKKVLPDGVAFRLKKGNGIMVNLHFLNTGEATIDGDAVIDVLFADTDPNRVIAAMSINFNSGFALDANKQSSSTSSCVAQSDVNYMMMANHMHEFGASARTEVTRKDGTVEVMHEDTSWAFDMQFNLEYTRWSVDAPFVLHAGDTIRTVCNWENTTASAMKFPREMCVGVGFALATGDNASAPSCMNGAWIPELL